MYRWIQIKVLIFEREHQCLCGHDRINLHINTYNLLISFTRCQKSKKSNNNNCRLREIYKEIKVMQMASFLEVVPQWGKFCNVIWSLHIDVKTSIEFWGRFFWCNLKELEKLDSLLLKFCYIWILCHIVYLWRHQDYPWITKRFFFRN